MVYCNDCARKRNWPISAFKVGCVCEVCMEEGACNEYPSSMLMPKVAVRRMMLEAARKKEEPKFSRGAR